MGMERTGNIHNKPSRFAAVVAMCDDSTQNPQKSQIRRGQGCGQTGDAFIARSQVSRWAPFTALVMDTFVLHRQFQQAI